MDQKPKIKKFKKINPNEYCGLMYGYEEIQEIEKLLLKGKMFRYASRKESLSDQFENGVKKFIGTKYALGVNNGTSALKTALYAVGVRSGDRVLISAYTFVATAAAVISLGAIPVPIDFDFEHGMKLDTLKLEVEKGCKVIIPVHLQGRCFDVRPIIEMAKSKGIVVIEDACQAFGAKLGDTFAGCFGDMGVFSFQQYKQVSSGEGGLVVTNNEKYFQIAKRYTDHGMVRETMNWESEEAMIGDNYRISNLQAALLKLQIKKIRGVIATQRRLRQQILKKIDANNIVNIVNSTDVKGETGMNIFLLLSDKETTDKVIAHAKNKNIEVRRMWDRPYYLQGVYKRSGYSPEGLKSTPCPVAEDIATRLVSISIPPILTEKHLSQIIREFRELKKLGLIN